MIEKFVLRDELHLIDIVNIIIIHTPLCANGARYIYSSYRTVNRRTEKTCALPPLCALAPTYRLLRYMIGLSPYRFNVKEGKGKRGEGGKGGVGAPGAHASYVLGAF